MGILHKYGKDWSDAIPTHQIELACWKHWREYPDANLKNPVEEHLYEACRFLFTDEQLVIHPWFETQAHSWTYDDFAMWWGCAGSGKSHSLGLFTLLDFITDPDCTFSLLASTSKEMLALRSFASVVQYLSYLKSNRRFKIPFKFVPSRMCVVPEGAGDDDIPNLKHLIKGVAVQQGTEAEARQNLQGVHTRYVRAIFDELEGMRSAAMDSRHNLSQCFEFKLLGACNPESIYGEAGKYSAPKAGWQTVSDETAEWETEYGKVYRFDARKSPGIEDPIKYYFLPTKASIDRILKANRYNEDAPAVWTMLRAFPPPQAMERTVLTEAMVRAYNMLEPITFLQSYIKVAAIDPAFSSGGDDCMYQLAKVGMSSLGVMTICYDRQVAIPILASSPIPVTEQIAVAAVKLLDEDGVDQCYLAVDDSGTQSVADAIATKRGNNLLRLNYSESPPDLPVSVNNEVSAKKKYKNAITWLYYTVKEYAERNQIKGLPVDAAQQMCKRRLGTRQQPHQLQSKAEHKKQLKGRSPDGGDCAAMIAGLARLRLGLLPGTSELRPGGEQPNTGTGSIGWDPSQVAAIHNLESSYSDVDSGVQSMV